MKNRSKREFLIAVPVFILLLIFGVSIPLIINIGDKMENSASKNLINATYIIENSVATKLNNDMRSINNFASSDIKAIRTNLRLLCRSGNFLRVSMVGTDGKGHSCEGEQVDIEEIGNNRSVMTDGKAGVSECYYGYTGRKTIAFGAPVREAGEVVGAIYAERSVEDYYSASDFSFFEGKGRGYLVDARTGDFVLKSFQSDGLPKEVGNLFKNLTELGNDDDFVREIKDFMAEEKTGTTRVNFNGKDSYICFTPVTANENWNLVTIISETDLMAESNEVKKTIILTVSVVFVGLILALGMAFLIALKGRKESERKKRTELLESITSTVDHAFLVYDPDKGTVEYASENLSRLFGLDSVKARQDVGILFDWLRIPAEDEYRLKFINGTLEEHYQREHKVIVNGQEHWVKSEVSFSDDENYVAVLTDVTKDKEYARTLSIAMKNAENASRAKSEFLSSMSHDIRTPMNGIMGMTAIAAANAGDEARVRDCLKKISDASAHLLNLINEVLDMSKIESGNASLNNEEFNLADFMYNLIQMNSTSIEHKRQKLSVNVVDVKHEHVIADQVKLQQVMTNIVSNANKYTPEGGKIEISLTEKPGTIKGYGCYEFICRDNGIGMSGEFVKRIFDPFERARDPSARGVQGTGLGMAIVKNIVDMMSGIIKVNSTPGEGTVLTVIVNLQMREETGEEKLPRLPVLVVDDDERCCANTVGLLEEIGLAGEWVPTGEEAIAKCVQAHERAEDYYAVILNWKMPEMDGVEVARRIRGKVGNEVPVIILTAYHCERVETEAREAGVTAVLPKPLFKSKLYHKFRRLIQNDQESDRDVRKAISSFDFQGKRILLVEDNELNMEIAVSILGFTKAEIDSAFDGKEALNKYLSMPEGYYDLILMDIQMPNMNGYETARAIRNSGRGDACGLPIIAMTANAFLEDRERAKEAGMNGHIAKPIDVQQLVNTLDQQFRKG